MGENNDVFHFKRQIEKFNYVQKFYCKLHPTFDCNGNARIVGWEYVPL